MSETKQLPDRADLPEALTWDLTKIYADDGAFEEAFQEIVAELKQADDFKGTLSQGPAAFKEALEYVLAISRKLEKTLCIQSSEK